MPGVNGLEAIAELSSEYPSISWIILSGYSDFDYAREALKLGVTDYLLKAATEKEVRIALQRAVERREEIGRRKRERFEYSVSGVINNSSAVEFDDFMMRLERLAAVVYVPESMSDSESLDFQRRICGRVWENIDNNPAEGYAGVFNFRDGYPAVIVSSPAPGLLLRRLHYEISPSAGDSCRSPFR